MNIAFNQSQLVDICQRYQVATLEVFGSQARGDAGPDSDVDVLVTFVGGQVPGLEFFALALDLEAVFGRSVDLLTRRSIEQSDNPFKRDSILSTIEPLYVAA